MITPLRTALACLGAVVLASDVCAALGPDVVVTATPAIVSQYMFRGQRLGGFSFQPTVEVASGDLGGGIWASVPIEGKVDGISDPEVDLYGYFKVTLGSTLNIVPGFTWYTFPRANRGAGFHSSTFEPSLALNFDASGVKLTPKVYYDLTLEGPTLEMTAAYAHPLRNLGTELDVTATVGDFLQRNAVGGSGPNTRSWGRYWLAGISIPKQLTVSSRVMLGLAYTSGESAFTKTGGAPRIANPLASGHVVLSLSFSRGF